MGKLKIIIFALCLVALPQAFAQRSIPADIQQKIDNFIQNAYLPTAGVDSLGLTIVQNSGNHGNILYTTGYGWANKEKNIQMGNGTQFLIGSSTKNFVGLLVAKLLHETQPDLGEAALDTPIRQLLPQANFILNDRFRTEHVSFRDLLAHRICLLRGDTQLTADTFNSTTDAVYGQRYNKEICGFRTEYQYNNHLYTAAGELAGMLVGKSFEDAFQDMLHELGMNNTAFVQKTDDFQQMPFRAMPYYMMDGERHLMNENLVKRLKNVNAAGGLFVSPNDMARYLQFHLNLGNLDGVQIVPKNVMKWLTKPSIMRTGYAFKGHEDDVVFSVFAYGLGLFLSSYDGWEAIQHGGTWPSYISLLSWYPAKQLGIFTSTNVGPLFANELMIHAFIFDLLNGVENAEEKAMKLGEEIKNAETKKKMQRAEEFQKFHNEMIEMAKKTILKSQNDIIGHYGSGSMGDSEIYEKFNEETNQMQLYFEYGPWYKGWLVDEFGGVIFSIDFDTDVVQDDYASVGELIKRFLAYSSLDGDLVMYGERGGETFVFATFKKGLRSGDLPTIPYEPDSCGPAQNVN